MCGVTSGETKLAEEFGVRTGDDVGRDQFANPAGGVRAGIDGGFDAADIAFDDDGDEAAANLDLIDELDVGGFGHRVSGFDATDVAFGFDHAECSAHGGGGGWYWRIQIGEMELADEFTESIGLEAAGVAFIGIDVDFKFEGGIDAHDELVKGHA
jgi:hypothetical protein